MSSPINNINVSPTASTTNRTSNRRRRSRYHQQQHQRTASDMLGLLGQARYKTRRNSSQLRNTDLPYDVGSIGHFSGFGFLWFFLFSVAPFAYIYIGLMVLRDLCIYFPETVYHTLETYVPQLAYLANLMNSSSKIMEVWCVIEALFYIALKLKIKYLQNKDPLEASLSAAPMLDPADRRILWDRMIDSEKHDPISFVSGWFFDEDIDNITRYDIFDFVCWSMFDGRNQEHLTLEEERELEEFIDDLEMIISLHLYGSCPSDDDNEGEGGGKVPTTPNEKTDDSEEVNNRYDSTMGTPSLNGAVGLDETDSMFSDLTNDNDENSNHASKVLRNLDNFSSVSSAINDSTSGLHAIRRMDKQQSNRLGGSSINDNGNVGLHQVESYEAGNATKLPQHEEVDGEIDVNDISFDSQAGSKKYPKPNKMFRFSVETHHVQSNFFSDLYESYKRRYEQYRHMVETADFHPVQDFRNILAGTAQQLEKAEESAYATATHMYETIVQPGSNMDKQLSALSHATQLQLSEAWNSVKGMKERFETAKFLSAQRESLIEQLRGNRAMLTRMRAMSYAVPSKQMAALMRKITECNDALERTEGRARDAFVRATGALPDRNKMLTLFYPNTKEPQRYAKYSSDPLLGLATYPLGFHLLVLGGTEIPLRVMMKNRGFERRCVGPVNYYYHPGIPDDAESSINNEDTTTNPIVFVHGIGVGIVMYIEFIDKLLKLGRPLLLPEIPYVSGFRPWLSPNSVLSPAVVASTLTAMLATHGFSKGTFTGHSYGTSWLSYICKYAPSAVGALLFLDPICFALHTPRLTKSFVYHRPDPGTVSFMLRTDITVNWTIQRAFPWAWIALFVEQINVPCTVFLSDKDALVPAVKVEQYLRSKKFPTCDASSATKEFFEEHGDVHLCIFRGDIHGGWTEHPADTVPQIVDACNALCVKAEAKDFQ